MKTKRYLIAAALIGISLLMGCNKGNSLENNLAGTTATPKISGIAAMASVTYQLQTLLPPAGALIKWDNGAFTTSELTFNGATNYGEMLTQQQYNTNVTKTYNLFGTTTLGSVSVPYSAFSSASFTLQLNAINVGPQYPEAHPRNTISSLELSGTFDATATNSNSGANALVFQEIPVQVIINQALTLSSVWVSNATINQPEYLALFDLDLSQITNGIDPAMLDNAEKTNGTIIITTTSNPNLYGIIVENLQTNLMNATLSAQPSSPAPNHVAAAAPLAATQ